MPRGPSWAGWFEAVACRKPAPGERGVSLIGKGDEGAGPGQGFSQYFYLGGREIWWQQKGAGKTNRCVWQQKGRSYSNGTGPVDKRLHKGPSLEIKSSLLAGRALGEGAGAATVAGSSWKSRTRGTRTRHNPAASSVPQGLSCAGVSRWSVEMRWLCVGLLHQSQQHSRDPALQQAPQRDGLFWGFLQLSLPECCSSSITICSCRLGLTLAGL